MFTLDVDSIPPSIGFQIDGPTCQGHLGISIHTEYMDGLSNMMPHIPGLLSFLLDFLQKRTSLTRTKEKQQGHQYDRTHLLYSYLPPWLGAYSLYLYHQCF